MQGPANSNLSLISVQTGVRHTADTPSFLYRGLKWVSLIERLSIRPLANSVPPQRAGMLIRHQQSEPLWSRAQAIKFQRRSRLQLCFGQGTIWPTRALRTWPWSSRSCRSDRYQHAWLDKTTLCRVGVSYVARITANKATPVDRGAGVGPRMDF